MSIVKTALAVLTAAVLFAAPAAAVSIRFVFEAEFNGNLTDSPDGTIAPFFQVGDVIKGRYAFESTTAGAGGFYPAVTRLRFEIDRTGYTGRAAGGQIQVSPIPGNDFYTMESRTANGLHGADVGANEFFLFDVSVNGDFLGGSSDLLLTPPPVTPLDNGGSNTDRVELLFSDAGGAISGAAFDLLSLAVPEPSVALLLASALAAMGIRRRRA